MRKRGLANRERRGWREGVVKEPLFSPRSSVSCGPAQLQGADGIIGQVFPSVFPVRRWEEEGRLVFLGGDKIKTVEDVSFHLHVLTSCRSTLLGWTRQEVEKGSLSHQLVSLKELSRESTSPPSSLSLAFILALSHLVPLSHSCCCFMVGSIKLEGGDAPLKTNSFHFLFINVLPCILSPASLLTMQVHPGQHSPHAAGSQLVWCIKRVWNAHPQHRQHVQNVTYWLLLAHKE